MSDNGISGRAALIGLAPHNFAGASKIATSVLRECRRIGIACHYVGFFVPHLYRHVPGPRPELTLVELPHSNVLGRRRTLEVAALSERAAAIAEREANRGRDVTLWGTYLFPFGQAALTAKSLLFERGVEARLVISPAGSDIWELAPQLPRVAEQILFHRSVDLRLTYTKQFALEINRMFSRNDAIADLYPIVDADRFVPLGDAARQSARQKLNLSPNDFVICCHCNMRPIKQPTGVMEIASAVAMRLSGRRVVLMMVGPRRAGGWPRRNNLEVRCFGIIGKPERMLQVSDVCLNWSAHDSFNCSLMEGMSCGVPLVTSDVVGIGSEIVKANCGALFPLDKATEAIAFLEYLALNPVAGMDYGARGTKHARAAFGSDELLPQYRRAFFNRLRPMA